MGIIELLLLQFIAHLFTGFFFQTNKQAKERNELGVKSLFISTLRR